MPSGDSMNASRVYKHKPTHNTDGRKRQDDYDVESGMISGSFPRSLQIVEQSVTPIKASLADFESDMRLLSSLRHPCITTIMGAVVAKHQEPCLVMEYMEHKSLSDLLQKSTMALAGGVVHTILRDISQGIQFLHNTKPQIVHGDVKSDNIFVDSMFRAKVSDFGVTYKTNNIEGTLLWMAPELLRNESDCTSASDVYAFGILLYELYARKQPFAGQDVDTVIKEVCDPLINRRPGVPTTMPSRIEALMQDCLVTNPSERPSMDEIVSRIRRFSGKDVAPQKLYAKDSLEPDSAAAEQRFAQLLETFPRHVAEALRDGEEVSPEDHECVTVLFCEIEDMALLSTKLPQKKFFSLLERLYGSLDDLAKEKDVFKVQTTGETWMGVTNCAKDQSRDHIKRMAVFALAAVMVANQTLIDSENEALGYVQLRIGFHVGPVLSNVIGVSSASARYALFGDTVNVASKIAFGDNKNHFRAGLVLCSPDAAQLLGEQAPEMDVSPLEHLYWVNDKGRRAAAAFERVKAKQKLRMLRTAAATITPTTGSSRSLLNDPSPASDQAKEA